MTKKDDEGIENSPKCCICHSNHVADDVKLRNYCHTTKKYEGSAHRDCNVKVKLNDKIRVASHNLKNYDSRFIMQKLAKIDYKIYIITNRL